MKIKKPYFWDLQKPNFISYLLLPFTVPIILNNLLLNKNGFINQLISKNTAKNRPTNQSIFQPNTK